MTEISGIDVVLYERTEAGTDALGAVIWEETPVTVPDVLVSPVEATTDPPLSSVMLTGKEGAYVLGIPKGDTHTWEDRTVEFFGQRFRTESFSWQGIDGLIPLRWNRKIVARRFGA